MSVAMVASSHRRGVPNLKLRGHNGGALLGMFFGRALSHHHLSTDSRDVIKLGKLSQELSEHWPENTRRCYEETVDPLTND